MNLLTIIWNWQIEPLPILLSLVLYFVPVYWREKHSDSYTPLYFSIYPLSKLNVPLARYLGQGFFHDYFDDNDAEKEKKILKIKSIYSGVIYVIITPVILAFIWTIILTERQFIIVVTIVILSIIYRFIKSTYSFNDFTFLPRRKLLAFFYFIILSVFSYLLIRSYMWLNPLIHNKEYKKIFTSIGDFIFFNIFISIVLVGILIPVVISIVFNREVREKNLEEINSYKEIRVSYNSEIDDGNKYYQE